eukprot:m.1047539 g.1047539  ORF g.1047539 m.1047539 type:complete len:111 (+) comp24172_c0_seq3:1313-1645(+)
MSLARTAFEEMTFFVRRVHEDRRDIMDARCTHLPLRLSCSDHVCCLLASTQTVQLEATCTLCHAAGLACDSTLDPAYVGDVYNDDRTFITPNAWSDALKNKPNKLFHPVG